MGEGIWHPLHFCLALGFLEHLLLFLTPPPPTPYWQLFPRAVFLEDARKEMSCKLFFCLKRRYIKLEICA